MRIELETGEKLELPDGSSPAQIDEVVSHFQSVRPAPAQQEIDFFDRLKQGMADANVGFNQRATDLQVAAKDNLPKWASNVLTYEIGKGVPSREELLRRKEVLTSTAQDIAGQKKGDEGFLSNVQRGLGNPAMVASTLAGGPIWASAFGGGAGTEFLTSSPEGKTLGQKAGDAGLAGATSAVVAPLIAKGIDSALHPVQTVKNVGSYLGKLLGVEPERLATFEAAKVTPTLGDVSKSGVVKRTQNVLDDVPLASTILDKGKARVAEGIEEGLTKAGYDPTYERAVGGDATKQGLKAYVDRGRAFFNKAYDAFDAKHIAPDELTTATSTFTKINDIMRRADTAEALDAYLGPTEKAIIGKIKSAATPPNGLTAWNAGAGAPAQKPSLTYNDFKLFRTAIGKKLDDYTIGSSDKAVLRELYGAMTADLRQKASEKGSSTLAAFDRLNSNYQKFSSKLDDTVNEVLNKGEASQVFNAVRQGLALPERTGTIMRALPADQREIVRGALIREMGVARTQAGGGAFDPVRFAAEFRKLDPKAQDAFLTGLPNATREGFQKVVDAALLAKQTALQSNSSGTARSALLAATGVSGLTNPLLVAKVIGSGALTARLMTSPKFINWLANAPKSTGTSLGRHIGLLSGIAAGDSAVADDTRELQEALESRADPSPRLTNTQGQGNGAVPKATKGGFPGEDLSGEITPETDTSFPGFKRLSSVEEYNALPDNTAFVDPYGTLRVKRGTAAPASRPVPDDLFRRIIMQESGGKQSAVSEKGAIGIAQIMPKTAPDAAKAAGLPYDPNRLRTDTQYNAALGKAYLDSMLFKYGGSEPLALMAYNWGPGNVDKWLKTGANPERVPTETRNYLTAILFGG